METESVLIEESVLRDLSELKRPNETISELIGRLVRQHVVHSKQGAEYEALLGLFKLYLPEAAIVDYINRKGSLLRGERRLLAVMFTDVRSFTTISEDAAPEAIVQDLNEYFQLMTEIIYARGGTIDKFIGDAIMAYFGYPLYEEGTALQAVFAALEMIDAVRENSHRAAKNSVAKYGIGIGISLGDAILGNVGHPEMKLNFTILGDMVNHSSRLEGLTKLYAQDIIISESVQDKIKIELPTRLVDIVEVKGKGAAKLYTTSNRLSQQQRKEWEKHNEGMAHLAAREFDLALGCFREVLESREDDHLAKMMIERYTNR